MLVSAGKPKLQIVGTNPARIAYRGWLQGLKDPTSSEGKVRPVVTAVVHSRHSGYEIPWSRNSAFLAHSSSTLPMKSKSEARRSCRTGDERALNTSFAKLWSTGPFISPREPAKPQEHETPQTPLVVRERPSNQARSPRVAVKFQGPT